MRLAVITLLLRMRSRTAAMVQDGPLLRSVESACVELGIRQRVRLFVDNRQIVPLVWGIFHPRLVLPAEARE
jgi:hypothetical protein